MSFVYIAGGCCSRSKDKESSDHRGVSQRRRRPLLSSVRTTPALGLPRQRLAQAEPAGFKSHAQAFGHLSQKALLARGPTAMSDSRHHSPRNSVAPPLPPPSRANARCWPLRIATGWRQTAFVLHIRHPLSLTSANRSPSCSRRQHVMKALDALSLVIGLAAI